MDGAVIEALAKAGFGTTLRRRFTAAGIRVRAPDRAVPAEGEVDPCP